MPAAAIPRNELERLATLRAYRLGGDGDVRLDDVVRLAARLADCPMAMVSFVDAECQHLVARFGLAAERTPRAAAFCAHAILQPERPLAVPDALLDPRFADNPLVLGPPAIRAYLGVPLVAPSVHGTGHALGTLSVMDATPRQFDPATVETMCSLARTVVTTLELRCAMRRVQELALTDALTGLPNRTAFLDALSRAIGRQHRGGGSFSALYLDLDGFKALNDRAGHLSGDAVLVEVGQVLRGSTRRHDLPARLAGDEFALLLVEREGQAAAQVGERLCLAIARALEGRGVTASVGGVVFHAPPGDESDVLRAMDAAMYAAKRAGGNRIALHEQGRPGAAPPALLRAG